MCLSRDDWFRTRDCLPKTVTPRAGTVGGGRCRWAHLEFTRINITPTILRKKIEDMRETGAFHSHCVANCGVIRPGEGSVATGYHAAHAAIIEFSPRDFGFLADLHVGDVIVRHLCWPADGDLDSIAAAESLVASVQEWLTGCLPSRSLA